MVSLLQALAITLAGITAGTINTMVGSGTLITFPTLLFFGYSPLVANMSNSIGLLPGGLSGAYGYRRELTGQGRLVRRLIPVALAGGLSGALLLLVLPSAVFDAVVPALVGLGVLLVMFGPRLQAAARARRRDRETTLRIVLLPGAVFISVKNVLVPLVNLIAAVLFVSLRWAQIDWAAAGLIGLGSLLGGFIGSSIGRRLPVPVLRGVIIAVGTIAVVKLSVLK